MEPLKLSVKDTALVIAGRCQSTGVNGDMWNSLIIDAPSDYYNTKRSDYLAIELMIASQVEAGGTVIGTDDGGNPIQIGGMPSRPRPKGL